MTTAEQQVIDSAVHTLRPDADLLRTVRRRERFTVRAQDASGGQISEDGTAGAFDLSRRSRSSTRSASMACTPATWSGSTCTVGLLLEITACHTVNPRHCVAVTLRSGMDRILEPHLTASVSEQEKGTST